MVFLYRLILSLITSSKIISSVIVTSSVIVQSAVIILVCKFSVGIIVSVVTVISVGIINVLPFVVLNPFLVFGMIFNNVILCIATVINNRLTLVLASVSHIFCSVIIVAVKRIRFVNHHFITPERIEVTVHAG